MKIGYTANIVHKPAKFNSSIPFPGILYLMLCYKAYYHNLIMRHSLMTRPLISILTISFDLQKDKEAYNYQKIEKIKPLSFNEIALSPTSPGRETMDCTYAVYHFEQATSAHIPIDLTLERVALQEPLMIDLLRGNAFDVLVQTTPNSQE